MKSLLAVSAAVFVCFGATPALASSHVQGYRFITDTLAPGGGRAAAHVVRARTQSYRLITDTLAPGGGSSYPEEAPSGFSWSAAGIGASAAAGAVLVLLGGTMLVRRRSRLAL
jgi:hypothetical protein